MLAAPSGRRVLSSLLAAVADGDNNSSNSGTSHNNVSLLHARSLSSSSSTSSSSSSVHSVGLSTTSPPLHPGQLGYLRHYSQQMLPPFTVNNNQGNNQGNNNNNNNNNAQQQQSFLTSTSSTCTTPASAGPAFLSPPRRSVTAPPELARGERFSPSRGSTSGNDSGCNSAAGGSSHVSRLSISSTESFQSPAPSPSNRVGGIGGASDDAKHDVVTSVNDGRNSNCHKDESNNNNKDDDDISDQQHLEQRHSNEQVTEELSRGRRALRRHKLQRRRPHRLDGLNTHDDDRLLHEVCHSLGSLKGVEIRSPSSALFRRRRAQSATDDSSVATTSVDNASGTGNDNNGSADAALNDSAGAGGCNLLRRRRFSYVSHESAWPAHVTVTVCKANGTTIDVASDKQHVHHTPE